MQQTYTAVVKHTGDWWIGWIEEVPGVNCQEASRQELLETLRATLAEAIAFNRQEARSAAGHNQTLNMRSAVPRHTEVDNHLARKICKDLGVPALPKL